MKSIHIFGVSFREYTHTISLCLRNVIGILPIPMGILLVLSLLSLGVSQVHPMVKDIFALSTVLDVFLTLIFISAFLVPMYFFTDSAFSLLANKKPSYKKIIEHALKNIPHFLYTSFYFFWHLLWIPGLFALMAALVSSAHSMLGLFFQGLTNLVFIIVLFIRLPRIFFLIPLSLDTKTFGKKALEKSKEFITGRWWRIWGIILIITLFTFVLNLSFLIVQKGITFVLVSLSSPVLLGKIILFVYELITKTFVLSSYFAVVVLYYQSLKSKTEKEEKSL